MSEYVFIVSLMAALAVAIVGGLGGELGLLGENISAALAEAR
jgi:Flp pilus assembly pilin Flp